MGSFYRTIQTFLKQAVRSVAFLPVPMIFGALITAFAFFWLESNTEISKQTTEIFPALAITSQDTARTILGMFIGGLITLTVFTFTQIMTLLNQVASSYSPRLLPKLTGDRSLQFVMGLNLASIVLSIAVLLSIRSTESYTIPNFSILICTILGIACLVLFVYFVTSITAKIQVGNIIDRVANDALEDLQDECDRSSRGFGEDVVPPEVTNWYAIPSPISGYLGTVAHEKLASLSLEFETRLYIGVAKGQFVPRGLPLLQSKRKLNEEQVEQVLAAVAPIRDQFDDWYLPNLKQLTEIALKALSPGINDPGTALTVIDRQTEILATLMETPMHNVYRSEGGGEVWFARHGYREVLAALMQEMRCYGKGDPLVVRRLFQMLFHLLQLSEGSVTYPRYVRREIEILLADAIDNIASEADRSVIARDIRYHRRAIRNLKQSRVLDQVTKEAMSSV